MTWKTSDIKWLDCEISSLCNAGCVDCNRWIFNKQTQQMELNSYNKHIDQFVDVDVFVKRIKKFQPLKFLLLQGNVGDPLTHPHISDIVEKVFEIMPDVRIEINTNGSVGALKSWQKLCTHAQKNVSLIFSIDGLEDTNHIYRIGVKWDKLMKNVKAFNKAGGLSYWFFIPFFHNEHQIEEAQELSNELGCKEFVIKVSARFQDGKKPFEYEGGKLYPPTSDRFRFEKFQKHEDLKCVSEIRREIYVDAWSRLWPCCWTGSAVNRSPNWPMVKDDPNINSLQHHTIREILDSKEMNDWIQSQYSCDTSVCHKRCTGSYVHIIDRQGIQKPQKEYW